MPFFFLLLRILESLRQNGDTLGHCKIRFKNQQIGLETWKHGTDSQISEGREEGSGAAGCGVCVGLG